MCADFLNRERNGQWRDRGGLRSMVPGLCRRHRERATAILGSGRRTHASRRAAADAGTGGDRCRARPLSRRPAQCGDALRRCVLDGAPRVGGGLVRALYERARRRRTRPARRRVLPGHPRYRRQRARARRRPMAPIRCIGLADGQASSSARRSGRCFATPHVATPPRSGARSPTTWRSEFRSGSGRSRQALSWFRRARCSPSTGPPAACGLTADRVEENFQPWTGRATNTWRR